MQVQQMSIHEIVPYENNARFNDEAVDYVKNSIKEFGFQQPIVVDKENVIIAGHTRYKAAREIGMKTVPTIVADDLTEEQVKAYRLADNKTGEIAEWDFDKLLVELQDLELNSELDMSDFGFDLNTQEEIEEAEQVEEAKTSLNENFIVPHFSVIDLRKGYVQDRKRQWNKIIQEKGQARDNVKIMPTSIKMGDKQNTMADMSIINAAVAEIVIKWFTPNGKSKIFDTFAGDTVFGFVSAYLGNSFNGIELRKQQAEFNQSRADNFGIEATYHNDDGRNVLDHIEENSQDFYVSSPPYYDLEVYSDDPNDASNLDTYEEFLELMDDVIGKAVRALKNNRFAVWEVGDIRDKNGFYRGFPDDIIAIFKKHGMPLYNEIILIDPFGTAPFRANKQMVYRKTPKVHQNLLVFYKGDDPKKIKDDFPDLAEFNEDFSEELKAED